MSNDKSKKPSAPSPSSGKQAAAAAKPQSGSKAASSKPTTKTAATGNKQRQLTKRPSPWPTMLPSPSDIKWLSSEGKVHSSSGMYDCGSYLIHCSVHDRILLRRSLSSGGSGSNTKTRIESRWLPFTQLHPHQSWRVGALHGACTVMANGSDTVMEAYQNGNHPFLQSPPRCMQMLRVQMPQTQKFYTRLIYYFRLDRSRVQCCNAKTQGTTNDRLEWHSLTDIQAGRVKNLWGPEVVEYCGMISKDGAAFRQTIEEFSLDEAYQYLPRNPPRSQEEELLKSLRITEIDVERLYADFLDHSFPAFSQTVHSFTCYMTKYEFERDEEKIARLFRAFNYSGNGRLSFHEFLLGLTCMEAYEAKGECRAAFIFRYYNREGSGRLTEAEFTSFFADINNNNKTPPTSELISKTMSTISSSTSHDGQPIVTQSDFINAVNNDQFGHHATSLICRPIKSIFGQMARCSTLLCHDPKNPLLSSLSQILPPERKYIGVCSTCKQRRYHTASHFIEIDIKGEQTAKRHDPTPKTTTKKTPAPTTANKQKNITASQFSVECVFCPQSPANQIIQLVREFSKAKGTVDKPKALMQDRPETLLELVSALCAKVERLLEYEDRCQPVYSPCYVIGDIHGNIEDLMSLERTLWPQMPCIGSNYLFLGDYVDRGKWGMEVILYLLSFKILCPNKVTLLRGNHEVRNLQIMYTYEEECFLKWADCGVKMWELTNKVFDKLPACAVLDQAVFCAHGGIPRSTTQLEQINKVPRVVQDPEDDSKIVHEILWNDPCTLQQYLDACATRGVDAKKAAGFVHNHKRGTAFFFEEQAARTFLKLNSLTHIIRAHEVVPLGYFFTWLPDTLCLTIFSTSHYLGQRNLCAVVLADGQRFRIIHIDTRNNSSATD